MERYNILLVMCPFWDVKYPPIGIAYISEYLKSKGLRTKVLDYNIKIFHEINKEYKKYWDIKTNFVWEMPNFLKNQINECVEKILSSNVEIIGFSIMAPNQIFSLEVIKKIKEKDSNKIIISGGVQAPLDKCEYIDYHIEGEAEETIYELIKTIKNKGDITKIGGIIIYGKTGEKIKTKERKKTLDFDSLPFAKYGDFNLNDYTEERIGILGSRGCINKCAFCNDWKVWKFYSYKSAEKLFSEIKYHVNHNHTNKFEFFDLLLNGNIKELEKFCDLIINSKMKIQWCGNAIIRKEMTYNLLKKMKKAGCVNLVYGLESGSDKIIKNMGKKFTAKEAEQVLKDTSKLNIAVSINLMVGFPGETKKDFKKTLSFIKRNYKYILNVPGVATCFVLANSDLEKNHKKYGINISMNNSWYNWYDNEGNTYDLRLKRIKKVVSLLNKLKIPIFEVKIIKKKKSFLDSLKIIKSLSNKILIKLNFKKQINSIP